MLSFLRLLLALFVALTLSVPGVSAQNVLVNCAPPVGANLSEPPQVLVCRFAFPVDGTQSTIQVFNAQDERVDANDTRNFSRDPELVAITLKRDEMPTGLYKVRWSVTNEAGGNPMNGEFQIGIRTPVPDATPLAQPAPSSDLSAQATMNNTVRELIIVGLGGIALVAVSGLGIWLWQERRKPKEQEERK